MWEELPRYKEKYGSEVAAIFHLSNMMLYHTKHSLLHAKSGKKLKVYKYLFILIFVWHGVNLNGYCDEL